MPRTAITVQTPKGPFPGTVAADDLDYTWTAADIANQNLFAFTGRELILARNVDAAAAHNITLTSVDDPQKRKADVSLYSLGLSEFFMFLATNIIGWRQTDGNFYLEADDVQIEFAILKLPS